MNYAEFKTIFETKINALPYEKRLDLAIDVCKELYFDYQKFHELRQFGDPDIIIDAINLCKQLKVETDIDQINKTIARVEEITPDTEDFGTWDGSYALNCCSAVLDTLEYLLDSNPKHILNVGGFLIDTANFKIHEECGASFNNINSHPLMLKTRTFLISYTE